MKKIIVAKADITEEKIEDKLIEISSHIPVFHKDNIRCFYRDQAKKLYDVLKITLPQGTLDRLTMKLLEQEISLLRIALREEKDWDK